MGRFTHSLFVTVIATGALLCGGLSYALPPGPQIPVPSFPIIKECLVPVETSHALSDNHTWKLTCPLDDFRSRLRLNSRKWPSHVSLLVGHVLFNEFLGFRAKIQLNVERNKHLEKPEGFFWKPEGADTSSNPVLGPGKSSEAAFLGASSTWVEDFDLLLTPLFDPKVSNKKYGSDKSLLLKKEAGLLWFKFLNTAKLYSRASSEISERLGFLLLNRRDRQNSLSVMIDTVKQDSSATPIFREHMIKYLEKIPAKDDRKIRESEFEQWLFLWTLKGRSLDSQARSELISSLRRMWILFPKKEHKIKIRKLAIDLKVSRGFIGPSITQLKLDELLMHAQRQVMFIQGDQALVTMRQILKLPNKLIDKDKLWKAVKFHVRLYRIMDIRHKIPNLLGRYLRKGHFIDIPKKKKDREEFFDRLYRVGKWRWSYDTQKSAIQIFDQIIALNRAWGTDFKLASSFYVRARIAEQSGDRQVARLFFDQAIQELEPKKRRHNDLYLDLLWRKFFNTLDIAAKTNKYAGAVAEVTALKPHLNWKDEGSRWYFWMSHAHALEGNKKEAIRFFEKTYENEPLGYFSSLAGLELVRLGETPAGWNLDSAEKFWSGKQEAWVPPSFTEIFSTKTLKIKKNQDKAWAQIYALASIRRFKDLNRYLPSLERRAYVYAMGSRRKYKRRTKRRLLQKAAWLRLAVGDNIGALRMGELARITFEGDIGAAELAFLYPLPYKELIHEQSIKNKIDPWHVTSLIRQESAFNAEARSSANALGLMQIIPPVAEAEAKELKIPDFTPEMLLKPEMSVGVGTYHLSKLFYHFESSVIVSTAGYNAGRPPAYDWLKHYSHPLPYVFIDRISFSETRGYVRSILRNYVNYSRIYNDAKLDYNKLLKMAILMPKPTKPGARP